MSKSREQLNDLIREIDIQGLYCLDVGVQDKPTRRLTRGTPANYQTMDINPAWSPDICGDLNLDWRTWTRPGMDHKEVKYLESHYDVIFCMETLEHLWNPMKAIEGFAELLKPGGDLYLSVPFIGPHHDEVDYLRYTHEWFEVVLPMLGFNIIALKERVASAGRKDLINFYNNEGMRVSKIRPEYGKYTYPIGYFIHGKRNDSH